MQRGAVPRLIAQGKILDAATGFSTTIYYFPSPQLETASALHAVGVPIGKPSQDSPFAGMGYFTPHVVARNLAAAPQTVSVTLEYPNAPGWDSHAKRTRPNHDSGSSRAASSSAAIPSHGPGQARSESNSSGISSAGDFTAQLALPPLTVGSYSTEDLSLDSVLAQLPQPIPCASIRIRYSGTPGSMMAEVSSVDQGQDLVMDAKVQNEGNGWAGSGANPWHLDNNTESYVFLANMREQPARIGSKVWAKGQIYYLDSLQLAPHETPLIDLRKLRDAPEMDFSKHAIPAGATDGSPLWLRLDNVPVMGRLAVITRHAGVASSYDCCYCVCPGTYVETAIVAATTCASFSE